MDDENDVRSEVVENPPPTEETEVSTLSLVRQRLYGTDDEMMML